MSIWEKLGFKTFGAELNSAKAEDRYEYAKKNLHGEKEENARKAFEESKRIYKLTGQTPTMKLRMQETIDLKHRNGTAWVNLVLALYEQDSSIFGSELDLPNEVRRIVGKEKERRGQMSPAELKILDAAIYTIDQQGILNLPHVASENIKQGEQPIDKAA